VTLISPFVGRILDWYLRHEGVAGYAPADNPGVASVTRIYRYFKRNGYATQVMGASFRNTGQILALAGCDLLTISPDLLRELAATDGEVPRRLDPGAPGGEPAVHLDEPAFRWALNDDAMATEKLAEGIRNFARDTERLESLVADPAFQERAAS
jgi:transaldolase